MFEGFVNCLCWLWMVVEGMFIAVWVLFFMFSVEGVVNVCFIRSWASVFVC